MKMSEDKKLALYRCVHNSITDLRIKLKLDPKTDVQVAQLEHQIWQNIKKVLKIT
jgi:hypothetical protein